MNTIKFLYDSINGIFISLWGMSMVRLTSLFFGKDTFSGLDTGVTTGVGIITLIWTAYKCYDYIKNHNIARKQTKAQNALDLQMKQVELKMKEEELESMEIENDEKKTPE